MPAVQSDKDDVLASGVEYRYRVMPLAILGKDRVEGFRGINIRWKEPGRYVPSNAVKIDGTEFDLAVDTVIIAIGQAANEPLGLPTTRAGYIEADKETLATAVPGVFAGGDAVRGPALAVEAVADGKKAAAAMDKYLMQGAANAAPTILKRPKADISVKFCGVEFENPFILSAAPPSDDLEMIRNAFKAGWAGAVLKTTSIETEKVDLAYPMMTGLDFDGKKVVGFGNIDLISEHHINEIEERVRALKKEFPKKVVIASMMGSKKEEWQTLARRLKAAGVDMIECSFSCPQGTLGSRPGAMLAQDTGLAKTVAGWVKEAAGDLPVVIKITPQVADICDTARAVKEAGCDGVCASNTIPSLMGIDLETLIPNPDVGGKSTYSGMSGPAIKPLTLRCIAEITKSVGIPVTGTGGPTTWRDAVEFMLVGARTVQFCTAVMHYGYGIIGDLKEGVADYLDKKRMKGVSDLIGRSLQFITTHDELPRRKNLRSNIVKERCITCGECIISCRDGGHMAIKPGEDRFPAVDEEKCVGCGLCGVICPVSGCIELREKR
jgi:dihydropyrimidine dehydrogenase (NAD+) subunit PreA